VHLLRESGADSVITSSGAAGRLLGIATHSPTTVRVLEDLLDAGSGLDIVERPPRAAEIGAEGVRPGAGLVESPPRPHRGVPARMTRGRGPLVPRPGYIGGAVGGLARTDLTLDPGAAPRSPLGVRPSQWGEATAASRPSGLTAPSARGQRSGRCESRTAPLRSAGPPPHGLHSPPRSSRLRRPPPARCGR
jgi:hypothetical protein